MIRCADAGDADCMSKAEKKAEEDESVECPGKLCPGELTFPPMAHVDGLSDGKWVGDVCVPSECLNQQASTYTAAAMKEWGEAYGCGPKAESCSFTVSCSV